MSRMSKSGVMSASAGESLQRLRGSSFAETRSAVLDLIKAEGEVSRADLARRSGLTAKTISVIVTSLIESSVVVESGFAPLLDRTLSRRTRANPGSADALRFGPAGLAAESTVLGAALGSG
jgi:Winged helix-turn-helix DNA-binding